MSVTIKSAREIELMRAAGKILAKVHQNLGEALRPGMSTYEIFRPLKTIRDIRQVSAYPLMKK